METRLCRLLVLLGAVNLAFSQVANRIVGGQNGDITQWPWLVSLRHNLRHACGGSVLSAYYIMSAAHCFPKGNKDSEYDVLAGATTLGDAGSSSQSVLVEQSFKNPGYTEDAHSWDIVVVKLKNPLIFGSTVQPIHLPAANVQIPAGIKCWISGWGHMAYGESLGGNQPLQIAQVSTISRKTCNCLYHIDPSETTLSSILQGMICAGTIDGSIDACQGDSGGPLSYKVNNIWYQLGVVSWGDECGTPNRPGVYTSVSASVDWIKSIVPDAQVEEINIDQTPVPDNANGCEAADGKIHPYQNSAAAVLITLGVLPLYWLTAYVLTDP